MKPDANDRKVLFLAASGLEREEERCVFLDRVCAGDPELRRDLEGLLALERAADSLFDLAPDVRGDETVRSVEEGLGASIGRYRLLARIGEGGCGVVYLAEQREPVHRKVALKIIRLGMDTENVIARFRAERQSLAMMDHPNIARVFDAGATDSGRPYFVMELVDGERITDFCDQSGLCLRRRLMLFVQVCQAIQHAHQKGIIHRDIKPSNVLVCRQGGDAAPKVIDFGIAKASGGSDDDAAITLHGQFIGTPAYMSPEQAAGGMDVDTRGDIYSLGVLLYELIAGCPPFDSKRLKLAGVEETRRILREEEPPPPSRLAGHGKVGDLDWIVMKAMAKERHRRYDTANGLAVDVLRFLNDEPVSARPPSRLYRLGKLVRRNRLAFAAGGVAVIALLLGFAASTWLFLREKEAREQQARLNRIAEEARMVQMRLREQAEFREQVAKAAVQIARGNLEEADRLLADVPLNHTPVSLESTECYRRVADWHLQAGRWGAASSRFFSAIHSLTAVSDADDSSVSFDIMPTATALCMAGEAEEYEKFRHHVIRRFSATENPQVAEQLLKACLLKPADPELLRSLDGIAALVGAAVEDESGWIAGSPYLAGWSCFALGLKGWRDGDSQTARKWLHRSLTYHDENAVKDTSVQLVLAMILADEGRVDSARSEVEAVRETIESVVGQGVQVGNGVTGFWFDWKNAWLLLEEATAMLGG